MRILEFEVDKQRLRKNIYCDFTNIVAGTEGYLKAKFDFIGPDWLGCKKAASFWYNGHEYAVMLDSDNSCMIPTDALIGDMFEVQVSGMRDKSYQIKTIKNKVKQEVT